MNDPKRRTPTPYEEAFDKWRELAADFTTDELKDELQHLHEEQPPRDVETLAKIAAIKDELETRGERE